MPEPRWLVFRYDTVALFSLKMSRATSTAGKTLLIPTPYAVKMAFVDAGLRHRLIDDRENLIAWLARADLRIGVPQHACVTGTIQSVRQETREIERKRNPELPPYRGTIAMREFVHCRGPLRIALPLDPSAVQLTALLLAIAPAINYFGKRGSFVQYLGHSHLDDLDDTFTVPLQNLSDASPGRGLRATLDDFGPKANFDALNSFSSTPIERGVHRKFVETLIPLRTYNAGPGFVHYCSPSVIL
jgi:hypothetical protein